MTTTEWFCAYLKFIEKEWEEEENRIKFTQMVRQSRLDSENQSI